MAKLSNSQVERLAVNSIHNAGRHPNSFLRIDIPVGDKAPSFDGAITIFENNSEEVESYLNEVPVQVKGTQVNNFSKKTRTFKLNTTHYENYYKRGGCLLLVVEILDHNTTKIFYRHLLGIDLYEIIRDYGHQGTHSVTLRELNSVTLYDVCKIFSEQMIRQPQVLIESNKLKESNFTELMLTSPTFYPEVFPISDIFDHSFYQYGIKDGMEIPLRTTKMTSISVSHEELIEVINEKIEAFIEISINASKNTNIKIENTIDIKIDSKTDKITFNVIQIQSISSQLKVLKILEKIFTTGKIKFNSFYGEINEKKFKKELINLKKDLEFWTMAAKIFSDLGLHLETEFMSTDTLYSDLEYLNKMMYTNDYNEISLKNPEKPSFLTHYVGGLYLILFYNSSSKDKFVNPFTEEFLKNSSTALIVDSPPTPVSISPFLLLEQETLIYAKNLDFQLIINSYALIKSENINLIFDLINNFCLRCLKAFDATSDERFLDIILPLFLLLEENIKIKELKDIILVNKMQTILRKHCSFTEDESKAIVKLKINTANKQSNNIGLLFCLNVLLNSDKEAEYYFNLLDKEQKKTYREMPIFSYFNK